MFTNFIKGLAASLVALVSMNTATQAQDLPIIGITEITAPVEQGTWRRLNTNALNFQTMLETQMTKVGRFKIMERNRINEVLSEQNLSNNFGQVDRGFHVNGVDYLVYGAITDFSQSGKTVDTGRFKNEKLFTSMSVDLKIVDSSTGEVRLAETVTETLQTGNATNTGNFGSVDHDANPLTRIQRAVAKKLASVIATNIFPIEVIRSGDLVYLNYGDAILSEGDILTVFNKGESLIDPTTGLNLGSEETPVADLEVVETTDKFSKAIIRDGSAPAVGNIARVQYNVLKNAPKGPAPRRGRKI